ncbi:MAG: type II secretion system protein, partial [Elusimicrobiaceae bacterium]|nr:type II secretion system protein [Elusimicrobiaceae bacterium]
MLFACRKLIYKRFCMKKGFTLIELLVVVLI